MRKIVHIIIFLLVMPTFSFAIDPIDIAKADRSLWPYQIDSDKNFDIASKCEMLAFVAVFNQYTNMSTEELSKKTKVSKPNLASITQWKELTKFRILENFKNLSEQSLTDIIAIKKNSTWKTLSAIQLQKAIPPNLAKWLESSVNFYSNYINEQLRLAALNPRLTSEIFLIAPNEADGNNFAQKNFLLTFDDGPTVQNGNTDKLMKVLENYSLSGMFFVLGDNLKIRLEQTSALKLNDLYGKNSVYSHGKTHVSHQKYAEWMQSLDYTNDLINKTFGGSQQNKMVYFRPPYGQRNKRLADYLALKNSKNILWNIDSQDWSSKINAQEIADRQITLMLLWRKGILLFHDVHAKAQVAVPIIHDYFKKSNIVWVDSKSI